MGSSSFVGQLVSIYISFSLFLSFFAMEESGARVLRCVLCVQHCPCPFNCNATKQDKGRERGNLKETVRAFEWLNLRADVHSAERIKI